MKGKLRNLFYVIIITFFYGVLFILNLFYNKNKVMFNYFYKTLIRNPKKGWLTKKRVKIK